MELREAQKYADRIRTDHLIHSRATDAPQSEIGIALVTLGNRIIELEAQIEDCREEIKDLTKELEQLEDRG